jgi:hypothetical protein
MAEQQQDNQLQFLLSDLGTRIRDLEERSGSMKERILLIGTNLLETKEEVQQKVLQIEKQNNQLISEIKKMNSTINMISSELNNFVRKDEIVLIERMLKDFQPLEFVRKKDLEEMTQNKINQETAREEKKSGMIKPWNSDEGTRSPIEPNVIIRNENQTQKNKNQENK